MNVVVVHGDPNPNTSYVNSRGIWLTYVIVVVILHYVCLSLPFLTVGLAWTLSILLRNLIMFMVLHLEKGTPFETSEHGRLRFLTAWEQTDIGTQLCASRTFLTVVPIVLFFLASFYTKYDPYHFIVNTVSLLSVLLPKLPMFHGVRIFGINKY
ncbi:hypothetical protein NP493_259g01004 [Ridgeia piscesae]|uniref:ORM1-like protein n=1 Tax=Ridgeia piscesae TaxID=27915 RepID=A0AAD9NY58_RIDPI|nr:hypothetical protein NP493_259g01004 [Ridgeia piscesae]